MTRTATRVIVVPGAAVSRYALPAVAALRARGLDAELADAPGSPGVPTDLARYGGQLAARLADRPDGPDVDVLVGLSVGAQVAAVAAAHCERVRRVLLVSPTVDPEARTGPRLLGRWLRGGRLEPPRLGARQLPDWARAGPRRVAAVVRSAIEVHIEDHLDRLAGRLTVVHAERDVITSHAYAARLVQSDPARLVVVPGATHSWPYQDEARFADLVESIVERTTA
ncbi:alpha/beta fold hydrolase [Pseudonocardia sp. TRM90224]|uniref:alpha/beta fold hydrolase n=1 Tax=Pseudonocardia sp. TRM90224 TaxID=2812678 RepID=UPI001E64E881|nr:alpha/beta fold hydrolase [Pseudonocardia sp. TRM90224]